MTDATGAALRSRRSRRDPNPATVLNGREGQRADAQRPAESRRVPAAMLMATSRFRGGSRTGARPVSAGQNGRQTMAVVNVIELLGESEQGWEDATRQVVAEATRTLRGVTSVYIKE